MGTAAALSMAPALLRAASRGGPADSRPNFLFIMADDMGWGDLGCYGRDDIATPNIDSLARDGMKFHQAYANSPVCSPTRVGLITGRYQYRLRVGLDEAAGQAKSLDWNPVFPPCRGQLRNAGYHTSLVGKWHMGMKDQHSPSASRLRALLGNPQRRRRLLRARCPACRRPEAGLPICGTAIRAVEVNGYLTDLIGDRVAREISRLGREPRPFMLSAHFTAPHWPWETPDDEEAARALTNNMHFDGGTLATYRRMVESLDQNVGRILAALKASGREDNTIVVFTSDNGGERFSKTWPFNGMKGEVLEGGIRTPLLVRWPGRVNRGTTSEQVAISMDWVPTFLDAAGVPAEARAPADGMSLLNALREGRAADRDLYWRYKANDQAALRRGQWKYLRINGAEYLFDVVADPQERGNLRTRHPERFAALKADWDRWNAGMLAYTADSTSWNNKTLKTLPDRY